MDWWCSPGWQKQMLGCVRGSSDLQYDCLSHSACLRSTRDDPRLFELQSSSSETYGWRYVYAVLSLYRQWFGSWSAASHPPSLCLPDSLLSNKALWKMVSSNVTYSWYVINRLRHAKPPVCAINRADTLGGFYVLLAGLAISCLSLSSSFSRCCSFSSASFCFCCCSFKALFWRKTTVSSDYTCIHSHPSLALRIVWTVLTPMLKPD